MRPFLVLAKISLIDLLEYRLDILFYTIGTIVRPVALLAIWLAAYASGAHIPMERGLLIQYYLILLVVNLFVEAWGAPFIMSAIRLGKLSPYILKPFPYFFHKLVENLTEKMIKICYLLPIIILLGWILKVPWPIFDTGRLSLFVVTLFLAFTLSFLIDFIVGVTAFWLDESQFVSDILDLFAYIFSGFIFPIALLPGLAKNVAIFLPFRYTVSLPLEIAQNTMSNEYLIWSVFAQLAWVLFAVLLARYLWNKGIKKYSASGA